MNIFLTYIFRILSSDNNNLCKNFIPRVTSWEFFPIRYFVCDLDLKNRKIFIWIKKISPGILPLKYSKGDSRPENQDKSSMPVVSFLPAIDVTQQVPGAT